MRQSESLCFLSGSEGVSGQTADIPAVRWVESLREPGKCLSHTQALNLTYFKSAAAISHRELIADIHASCIMISVFTGLYVKLYEHYLFVLISAFLSNKSIFHHLAAGVWHIFVRAICQNIDSTCFSYSLHRVEVMYVLPNLKSMWVTWF